MTSPDAFAPESDEGSYRPGRERSIAALLANLAEEVRRLFRLELALFKAELAEKASRLGRGVAAVAAGAIIAFSSWLALLAAAVLALAIVLPPWLAALIVGLVVLLVAGLLLFLGKRWLELQSLVPRRSFNSLRKDRAWVEERLP